MDGGVCAGDNGHGHQASQKFITEMANDKLPPWFMQEIQGADLLAISKEEGRHGETGDHRPVFIPNTISKLADKAMIQDFRRTRSVYLGADAVAS